MTQPLGRINPALSVACPTCRKMLSENALELALQGKTVRCSGCRADIKLTDEVRQRIRKSRPRE